MTMIRATSFRLAVSFAIFAASGSIRADGDAALSLFEKRVLPILNSPKPSSCSECHLSGVDLKDYIRKDQKETFASLVAAGLVDVKRPDESKILKFIAREPSKPTLVSSEVRKEEYEAFRAWLTAAVKQPELLKEPSTAAIGPSLPDEVIRHARKDRVLASFIENVWNEVGRCAACHSPERNAKQVEKHGEQVSWIKPRDPQGTMSYMLEAGIIDAKEPKASLLLRKPTMQVEHGGGQKMAVGDRTYKQFLRFLDDYSATAASRYKTADQLPSPTHEVSTVTEIWLKLTDVPEELDKKLLQVDLHRWTGDRWSEERWATSDRPIFGKGKLWQHSLSLTAPRDSERGRRIEQLSELPKGKYLIKVYVDRSGKLAADEKATLGAEDLVGEVEVESKWPAGYAKMTVVSYPPDK